MCIRDSLDTPMGKITFVADPKMPPGEAILANHDGSSAVRIVGLGAALDPVIRAEHIWKAAYLGDSPAGMLRKKLSPLFGKEDHERVLTAWENYCNNVGAAYTNVDKFVATWGSWEAGVPSRDRDTMAAHREVFGS